MIQLRPTLNNLPQIRQVASGKGSPNPELDSFSTKKKKKQMKGHNKDITKGKSSGPIIYEEGGNSSRRERRKTNHACLLCNQHFKCMHSFTSHTNHIRQKLLFSLFYR